LKSKLPGGANFTDGALVVVNDAGKNKPKQLDTRIIINFI